MVVAGLFSHFVSGFYYVFHAINREQDVSSVSLNKTFPSFIQSLWLINLSQPIELLFNKKTQSRGSWLILIYLLQ